MVQETSLRAFEEVKQTLGNRQRLILNSLKTLKVANNQMLSRFLKKPINTITPRVNELRDMKLVTFSHEGSCPITKRNTMFWKLTIIGEENSELIDEPITKRLIMKPFMTDFNYDSTIYRSQILSSSKDKFYNVSIIMKWDAENKKWFIENKSCECSGFLFRKDCNHINRLIEELNYWDEI